MNTRLGLSLFAAVGGIVGALVVGLAYVGFAIYGLTDPDWDLEGGGMAIVIVTMFMLVFGVILVIAGATAGAATGLLAGLLTRWINLKRVT